MEKTRAELFMDWMESIHAELGEGLSWGNTISRFPDMSLEWVKGNVLECQFKDGSSVQVNL